MTRKTYCGNLLWQSGLTLLAHGCLQVFRKGAEIVYLVGGVDNRKAEFVFSGRAAGNWCYFDSFWQAAVPWVKLAILTGNGKVCADPFGRH